MPSLLYFLVALLLIVPILGYKVLFLPITETSHIVMFSYAAEAWVKAGHEAHVVKHHSVPVPSQFKESKIHYVNHGKKGVVHFLQTKEFAELIGNEGEKGALHFGQRLFNTFKGICDVFMDDEDLFHALKKENYDFVVADNIPGQLYCLHAIAYRLDVPYGTLGIMFLPFNMFSHTLQVNFIDRTVPMLYTKEPSFFSRFVQFFLTNILNHVVGNLLADNSKLIHYLRDKPLDDFTKLKSLSKIWLVDNEPLFDAPKNLPPNIVNIAGLSAAPVKELPKDVKEIADSAKEGLVIVSFGGSMTAVFPEEVQRKLLAGLGMLKQKVIIRLKKKPKYSIASNIFITKWLPQNDLLGHPNTVLFITHCGLSSVIESLHRGVPMLGFPNQDEQLANAFRIQDKNFGLYMDRKNFTSEELKTTVYKILGSEIIKHSVEKAFEIIKSRRFTATEEVVYWLEHVIKFGSEHLETFTSKLAWYEVMMFDIVVALKCIVLVMLFITVKCCRCLKRCCCGRGTVARKEKIS